MIEDVLYIHRKLDLLSGEEIDRCLMSRANSKDETYISSRSPKQEGVGFAGAPVVSSSRGEYWKVVQ